jgi:hypothetical protein
MNRCRSCRYEKTTPTVEAPQLPILAVDTHVFRRGPNQRETISQKFFARVAVRDIGTARLFRLEGRKPSPVRCQHPGVADLAIGELQEWNVRVLEPAATIGYRGTVHEFRGELREYRLQLRSAGAAEAVGRTD